MVAGVPEHQHTQSNTGTPVSSTKRAGSNTFFHLVKTGAQLQITHRLLQPRENARAFFKCLTNFIAQKFDSQSCLFWTAKVQGPILVSVCRVWEQTVGLENLVYRKWGGAYSKLRTTVWNIPHNTYPGWGLTATEYNQVRSNSIFKITPTSRKNFNHNGYHQRWELQCGRVNVILASSDLRNIL